MKFIKGFGYAFKGIWLAISTQLNMKVHLLAVLVVVVAGIFFELDAVEWSIIFVTFGLVLATETMNTAVEYLVDFISPEYHEKAGKIKDLSAGAVLITAIIAVAVAITIFGNKFFNQLL